MKKHMNTKKHNYNVNMLVTEIENNLYTDIINTIIFYLPSKYNECNNNHINN